MSWKVFNSATVSSAAELAAALLTWARAGLVLEGASSGDGCFDGDDSGGTCFDDDEEDDDDDDNGLPQRCWHFFSIFSLLTF